MTDLIDWLREQIAKDVEQWRLILSGPRKNGKGIARDRLAYCEAHTALLDELIAEKHHVCDGDSWYTCAAATEERDGGTTARDDVEGCDCGRDAEVDRRVRILATAYRHRPGYRIE